MVAIRRNAQCPAAPAPAMTCPRDSHVLVLLTPEKSKGSQTRKNIYAIRHAFGRVGARSATAAQLTEAAVQLLADSGVPTLEERVLGALLLRAVQSGY